jgi:hypothetical protein
VAIHLFWLRLCRETKYDSSMEKVAAVVEQFCTFPAIERVKLLERTLFSFLTGNEDMHLKNFSLITRQGRVGLAPAYDFLNTTIALKHAREELALPLRGKNHGSRAVISWIISPATACKSTRAFWTTSCPGLPRPCRAGANCWIRAFFRRR